MLTRASSNLRFIQTSYIILVREEGVLTMRRGSASIHDLSFWFDRGKSLLAVIEI